MPQHGAWSFVAGHAGVITPATIADIKDDLPSLRVLQWNVDPIFDAGNVGRIASKLDVVDATLVFTAGEALRPFARPGKVVGFLPNPVDYSIETGRNHEQPDLPYGLFYSCGNGEKLRHSCGKAWRPDDLIQLVERAVPGLRTLLPGLRGQLLKNPKGLHAHLWALQNDQARAET